MNANPAPTPQPDPVLTPAERGRLVAALQRKARAKARSSPMAAILGVLAGDLTRIAHHLIDEMSVLLADDRPATLDRDRVREDDVYLKFVRQIDRLADRERQCEQASEPPNPYLRRADNRDFGS